ncbi:MAG: cell division protein FtsZ, partial [Novosphingobium sp.]
LFEGTRRMRAADAGIEELQKHVDTLIVIPNQNLFLVAKAETTFKEAFQMADEVLQQGVRSITDLMVMPGLINLDFADVRSVMAEMGKAMMGTGEGQGENRALEAAEKAIANPLLDGVSMQGAKGVIISIIGGEDMKLLEVDEAANHIRELVDPNANIIWGSAFNPDLQGKIRVSVVATGIEQTAQMAEEASRPFNMGASRGPARPAMSAPAAAEPLFDRTSAAAPEPAAEPEQPVQASVPEASATEATNSFADDDWDMPASSAEEETAGDPLELDLEAEGEPATGNGQGGGDELLLDASRLVEEDAPVSGGAMPGRRRGLISSDDDSVGDLGDGDASGEKASSAPAGGSTPSAPASAQPAPKVGSGATLFERMANLSRGGRAASDDDEDEDGEGPSISIPRFLGRQNNQ